MKFFSTLAVAASAIGSVVAQGRPSNISVCDYYTTALLKNNTGANQYKLLTLLVNTAVIGNYTQPNMNAVPGILNPGTYNGTNVNLLPYFSGALLSSNRGGQSGVSVNFLDGGGAAPLKMNMPANNNSSNQYTLLTHLYEYFGAVLNCSDYSKSGFPAYAGQGSMYNVHKFMDLNQFQIGYFIQNVGLSAASFGVTTADVTAVGMALNKLFNYRCSPNTTVIPAQGAQLQSICDAASCPLDPNSTCQAYPLANGISPMPGNATMSGSAMGSGSPMSGMPSATSSGSSAGSTGSSGGSSGSSPSGSSPSPSGSSTTNSGADKNGIAAGALALAGAVAAFAL